MEHKTQGRYLEVFKAHFYKDNLRITEGYHETVSESIGCRAQWKTEQASLDLLFIGHNDRIHNNIFLLVGEAR